jgi:hypothetical protein
MPRSRAPQYLAFKGWFADGPEIRCQCRLVVKTSRSTWVETGPILTLIIPADRLLEEGITNAALWAQHDAEVREKVRQAALDAANQPPLF